MIIQTKEPKILRDAHNMGLLNSDAEALNKYKEEKRRAQQFNKLNEDFSGLKSELDEIKTLLKALVK